MKFLFLLYSAILGSDIMDYQCREKNKAIVLENTKIESRANVRFY